MRVRFPSLATNFWVGIGKFTTAGNADLPLWSFPSKGPQPFPLAFFFQIVLDNSNLPDTFYP